MPLDRITQPQTSRDGLFIAKLQKALERCSTLIDNIVGSRPDIRPIQNCRLQANDVVLRYAFRVGENLRYSLRDSDLFENNVTYEPSYEQKANCTNLVDTQIRIWRNDCPSGKVDTLA